MKKAEFLKELNIKLKCLSESERKKFILYYEEIIEDYIENGYTEEEAIEHVGNPNRIAEDIKNQESEIHQTMPTAKKVGIGVLLLLGFPLWGSLLLAGILLVLSGYILIWCLPFMSGTLSIGFFVSALINVFGAFIMIIKNPAVGIMQFGFGIASVGIAILLGIATLYLVKQFIVVTKKFTIKVVGIFKK